MWHQVLVPVLMLLSLMVGMPRAHAQTPSGGAPSVAYTLESQNTVFGTSPTEACTNFGGTSGFTGEYSSDTLGGTSPFGRCNLFDPSHNKVSESRVIQFSCSGSSAPICQSSGPVTCPGGSQVQANGSCQCPSTASSWNGTQCVKACDPGVRTEYNGDPGAGVNLSCVNGCQVQNRSTTCFAGTGGKSCLSIGSGTGLACSTPTPTTHADVSPCGNGEVPMLINGQSVCTTLGGPGTSKETRTVNVKTNADGSKEVTTTTGTSSGGSTSTSSTTQNYSSGGAEVGNPTKEEKEEEDKVTVGTVVDVPVGTQSGGGPGVISAVAMGGGRSCPAPILLPKGASFSFSGICQFGDGIRPVILAMAWLAAGLIAFGSSKS
jgi:hypothetical protein